MAFTYSYDPTKIGEPCKDQMRFELGDTMTEGGSDTCALCDEEYTAVIGRFPKRWKRAKLACLESIFHRFAYEPDTGTGPLDLKFGGRARLWKEEYDKLKAEVGDGTTVVPEYGVAPDGSVKLPYFYTGMMENEEGEFT